MVFFQVLKSMMPKRVTYIINDKRPGNGAHIQSRSFAVQVPSSAIDSQLRKGTSFLGASVSK